MSAPTNLSVQLADLPPAVAAAIAHAAERISDRTVETEGCRAISPYSAEAIITECLRSVLLGGPLPPASQDLRTAPPGMITVPIAMLPVRSANQRVT